MPIHQVKLEIFTPPEIIDALIERLSEIGACRIGAYTHVSSYAKVAGTWMPEAGSSPYAGKIGELSRAEEYKLEVRCPREKVPLAVEIIRRIHPYEEPAIHIVPLLNHEFGVS